MEKWADAAVQLPGDWGPVGEQKDRLKEVITNHAAGKVLEAACGFHSYVGGSPHIQEVVALDFCREALERYDRPERPRILYDLSLVASGEHMDFFGGGEFNTVSVSFAIDYFTPEYQVMLFREFSRILSQDGKLLVAGGTAQGYTDLLKQCFNPENCAKGMERAGFSPTITRLPLETQWERGKYYLVEGRPTSLL